MGDVRHVLSIEEKWTVTVPGHRVNQVLSDGTGKVVYLGDGWGVPYAALRLHRLDVATGDVLSEIRTRHQGVSALALDGHHLFAATDSRLFQLARDDLSVVAQWDQGLVRHCHTLVPHDGAIVMANWRTASVGCFDPRTGQTRRLKVGLQPIIVRHRSELKAIAGFDGGMSTLMTDRPKLAASSPTPPIANAAGGEQVWGTLAGPPEGGQGEPPVWTRRPTSTVVRLTGDPLTVELPSVVGTVVTDDARGLVWCIGEGSITTVDQRTGRITGSITLPSGRTVAHLDVQANLAFALEPHLEAGNGVLVKSSSTLTCHSTQVA